MFHLRTSTAVLKKEEHQQQLMVLHNCQSVDQLFEIVGNDMNFGR